MKIHITVALVVLVLGCNKPNHAPPSSNRAQAIPIETTLNTKTTSEASVQPNGVIDLENTLVENAPASAQMSKPVADDAAASQETASPPHVERFLLMAQGGPLIVEVTLTIDGRPLREAMSELIDAVLTDADSDGDGRPTWDEVIHSPEFKSGRYGNVESESETEAVRLVQLYDANKNGVFDREEATRFLTRNAGGSRPFSLSSSNEYRGYNQFDSPTLHLLDENRDGQLDTDEITAAPVRLRSRDADIDDILLSSDFQVASIETMPGQLSNRRRAAPDSAYPIDPQMDWDALLFSLGELYAYGGDINESSFSHRVELFTNLDRDADGVLERDEIQQIQDLAPHISFEVHFGQPGTSNHSSENIATPNAQTRNRYIGPKLTNLRIADTLSALSVVKSDTRISVELADSEVVFFANDAVSIDYTAQAQAQINSYDANNDGYLDVAEAPNGLPGIATSFDALDRDNDGKAYPSELADFMRSRAGASLSQIRARAADQSDAIFAAIDADHDARLESREIDGASNLLRIRDGNGDSIVTPYEFPGAMVVGLVRGDPQQGAALYVPPIVTTAVEGVPNWFGPMDYNGDGEVSLREFLGEPGRFAAMDQNSDGFLNVEEAAAFHDSK
jgi:Ca2+-binding EF-hand superfamily protein